MIEGLLKDNAIPTKVFADDNDYKIWGFHFFNQEYRMDEISKDFESLLDNKGIKYDLSNTVDTYGMVAEETPEWGKDK